VRTARKSKFLQFSRFTIRVFESPKGDQAMSSSVERVLVFAAALMAGATILLPASCQGAERDQDQASAPANVLEDSGASEEASDAADMPAGQRVFYASHSLMWDMPPC
jgi:hypothetical protein